MSNIIRCLSSARKVKSLSQFRDLRKIRWENSSRSKNTISFLRNQNPVARTMLFISPASERASSLTCNVTRPTLRSAGDFAGAPPTHDEACELSDLEYEEVCEETLQSLSDAFENLMDSDLGSDDYDVSYSAGVLSVNLGKHGTYVINKQTPNKQIWLSSPTSGPKRYDYRGGIWQYKHDGVVLHQLLTDEISTALQAKVDLLQCSYGNKD